MKKKKLSIYVDDDIYAYLKKKGEKEKRTLTEIIVTSVHHDMISEIIPVSPSKNEIHGYYTQF